MSRACNDSNENSYSSKHLITVTTCITVIKVPTQFFFRKLPLLVSQTTLHPPLIFFLSLNKDINIRTIGIGSEDHVN